MSESYIVSARKYRPDSFGSIVGQSALTKTLKAAIEQGKLAHAYLFCGPRGVGKTTAARVLAKTINCQNPTLEGEACNECESCVSFNRQRSFNIFELDAASNNSVDDIRLLIEQSLLPPVLGRYKVFIIDEVHMLSQQAFNAFLKTLEEPPEHAIFILATTERHKVLPTIQSRCQTYDFKRITVQDIADHLGYVAKEEGVEAEKEALELIAEKADGGMRDALSLFDRIASFSGGKITYQEALEGLNVLDYSYFFRLLVAAQEGDHRGLLLLVDEILSRGFDGSLLLSAMASFLRDLLVAQHPDTQKLLEKPLSIAERYGEVARGLEPKLLYQGIALLGEYDRSYQQASSKRLHLELAMLKMISLFQSGWELATAGAPSPSLPKTAELLSQGAEIKKIEQGVKPQEATPPQQGLPRQQAKAKLPVEKAAHLMPQMLLKKTRQQAKEEVKEEAPPLMDQPFSLDDLHRAWYFFVDQLKKEGQVQKALMLKPHLPQLRGEREVLFVVPSNLNRDMLTELMPVLSASFMQQLQNSTITFHIEVDAKSSKVEQGLMPRERLDRLRKDRPELDKLLRVLRMELK